MRDMTWGCWVREQRKSRKINRRELAYAASIDPSYVTLIERDGYVPKREAVERIAKALGISNGDALIMAGYVPYGCRKMLADVVVDQQIKHLPKAVRLALDLISQQSVKKQLSAIRVLRAHLGASSEMTGEPVT